MSHDSASSLLSDHSKKGKDGLGQQGSQIEEGERYKKKMKRTPYEIVMDPKTDISVKEYVRKICLDFCGQGPVKPSVRPLLGRVVTQELPPGIRRATDMCIGIVNQLDWTLLECQALNLAPSVERAKDIERVMCLVVRPMDVKVRVQAFGAEEASVDGEDEDVRTGNHVVVGTADKMLDLLRSKSLSPRNITMFVLDYADQMFALGLEDEIYDIFKMLPSNLLLGVFTEENNPLLREFTLKLMDSPHPVQPY